MALLQLGELLEGQRVDRAEQPQLAVELADAGLGRDALGQLRHRRRLGGLRLDVEVVAQHLDRRLQPQPGLGLVDLGPPGPLADLVERALGGGAATTAARRGGSTGRAPPRSDGDAARRARRGGRRGRRGGRRPARRAGRARRASARPRPGAARRGRGASASAAKPALGVVEAVLQELGPLGEPGGAHVEVAAAAGEHGGAGIELGAGLLAGAGGVGLGGLAGLQLGQQQLELGDPLALDGEVAGELVDARLQRLVLGLGLAASGLGRGQLLGRDGGVGRRSRRAGDSVGRRRRRASVERLGGGGAPSLARGEQRRRPRRRGPRRRPGRPR